MVVDPAKAEKENTETTPSDQELESEYSINLANGKKNLLCGDFPEAVACFQATSALQSERFGEMSHECAESYYYYGKALLELARVENGVLGNALKGVPQVEEASSESEGEGQQFEKTKNLPEEVRNELRNEVEAAMATEDEDTQDESEKKEGEEEKEKNEKSGEEKEEKSEEKEKIGEEEKSDKGGEKEKSEKSEEQEEQMECSESKPAETEKETKENSEVKKDETKVEQKDTSTSDPNEASTSSGVKEGETTEDIEDPDDVPNMQLAWEMLELAKVLYKKKPKSEENSMLIAQCHSKLGELGLEIENYSQSIGDFLECL
uniref:Tetratricopeptide SHNi-TPR domain-containing protein n=1 Tax=Ciona savignyi TaxID=51511 RepID=H2Y5A7_CIOSA